jgi:hypothetical protein
MGDVMMIPALTLAILLQTAPGTPSNLEVERTAAPASVGDNTPDFRAMVTGAQATRYRIQVQKGTTNIWSRGWTAMTATNPGAYCPEIAYAGGTALLWNTPYRWRIGFANTRTGPWSPYAPFTMAAPSGIASGNGNGSPGGASWRFIGVPIRVGTTVPASELLDDVSVLYRVDEPTRAWVPMASGDVLEGGRGYLAWTAAGAPLDLFQGTVASGVQRRSFPYTTLAAPAGQEVIDGVAANSYRGNCLACNPFNAAISWDTPARGGHVSRQNISAAYWKWDGTQYLTYNASSRTGPAGPAIAPFQAFGIIALGATNRLSISQPPPTTGAPKLLAKTLTPSPNRWGLNLEVRSSTALDTDTVAGIDFESHEAWDERDTEEPGAGTATWVLASFDHKDWSVNPRSYTHDFRPTPVNAGDEVSWTLTLDGNTNAAATVTWPGVASIPSSEWALTLEDPAAGTSADLLADSSLDVAAVNGPRTLVLRARRLADFTGGLEVRADPGGHVPPAEVEEWRVGVRMLKVELEAVEEPVVVETLTVRNAGTGDPGQVWVSLVEGAHRIAGPSSFTGGAVTWTGLSERIEPDAPETWAVVFDFGDFAAGTYGVEVETGRVGGTGAYSSRSIAGGTGTVQGAETTVKPMAVAGDESGRCGLLGLEFLLLAPFVLVRRRRSR